MRSLGSLLLAAAMTGLLAWAGLVELGTEVPVEATEPTHVQDTDGDCLPDLLERVLLSDPHRFDTRGNDKDDLVEFLDRTLPGLEGASAGSKTGNTLRVGVTTQPVSTPAGTERVFWVHIAFRIQSGCMGELQAMGLFFQIGPVQVPLQGFFRDPRNVLRARFTHNGALIGVLSVRVSLGRGLELTAPFQFCAGGLIAGKPSLSAAYVFPEGRQYLHLLQVSALTCVFSCMDPLLPENQLWQANQICVTQMEVVGFSGGNVIYEVCSAQCKTFNGVHCPPTCVDRKGTVVVAPDGWGLIEDN